MGVLRRDLLCPLEQSQRADNAHRAPRAGGVNMLELEFAQASDRGIVRDHNEDYLGYALPEMSSQSGAREWLFALADGVGGQDQGEVASRTAVETLLAGFRRTHNGEQQASLLSRLVREANTKVFEAAMASGLG